MKKPEQRITSIGNLCYEASEMDQYLAHLEKRLEEKEMAIQEDVEFAIVTSATDAMAGIPSSADKWLAKYAKDGG